MTLLLLDIICMAILTDSLYQKIRLAEGGYQNQRTDKGNQNQCGEWAGTNFGITPNAWSDYTGKKCPSEADMRAIQESDVRGFMEWYGKKYRVWDLSDQDLADLYFNAVYGSGSNGVKVLQRTLNKIGGHGLKDDGVMGSLTLGAANAQSAADSVRLYNSYRSAYMEYLIALNNPTYTAGWVNRMNRYFPEKGGATGAKPSNADLYIETWKARGRGMFSNPKDFLAVFGLLAGMTAMAFAIFKLYRLRAVQK